MFKDEVKEDKSGSPEKSEKFTALKTFLMNYYESNNKVSENEQVPDNSPKFGFSRYKKDHVSKSFSARRFKRTRPLTSRPTALRDSQERIELISQNIVKANEEIQKERDQDETSSNLF